MVKALILTNMPSPYRRPLFETIGEKIDLTVLFTHNDEDRYWDESTSDTKITSRMLPSYRIGQIIINPTLLAELHNGEYDTIIVGENANSIISTLTVMLYCLWNDSKFVIWTEGIDTEWKQDGISGLLRQALDCIRTKIYSRADVCLGYSLKASEAYLKERGVPDERIVIGKQIYPKSEMETPSEDNQNLDVSVVFLGRLIEGKGVDLLIKSVNKWDEKRTLTIIGRGPERESLEKLAEPKPNVEFAGFVTGTPKADLLSEADVLVLPTRHDTWGLVINEAVYYQTPVVVTKCAGSAGLVSKTGVGVVTKPTEESIAQGINHVFRNYQQYMDKVDQERQNVTNPEIGSKPFLEAIHTSLDDEL
jgi:glycosyltransferase involved in cell wall biosynthesis